MLPELKADIERSRQGVGEEVDVARLEEARRTLIAFLGLRSDSIGPYQRAIDVEVGGEDFTLEVSGWVNNKSDPEDLPLYLMLTSKVDGEVAGTYLPSVLHFANEMNHADCRDVMREVGLITKDIIPLLKGKLLTDLVKNNQGNTSGPAPYLD